MYKPRSSRTVLESMKELELTPHLKKYAVQDAKKTFEENFNILTESIMDERFSRLKKYDLGFQLIDKTEDNTKALGVRGFRLKTLAIMPFFYENGSIGGYELLYLPRNKLFLPSTEVWVTYLTTKADKDMGKPEERLKDLYSKLYPNLLPLRRPITFKTSSYILPKALKKYASLAKQFIVVLDKLPFVVDTAAKIYGPNFLKQALHWAKREIPHQTKVAIPVEILESQKKLKFYSPLDDPIDLSPKELEKLHKFGYLVKDAREDNSLSKIIPKNSDIRITTVSTSGIYDILLSNGKTKKCVVIYPLPSAGDDFINNQLTPIVIDYYNTNKVYTVRKPISRSNLPTTIDDLPAVREYGGLKSWLKDLRSVRNLSIFKNPDGTVAPKDDPEDCLYIIDPEACKYVRIHPLSVNNIIPIAKGLKYRSKDNVYFVGKNCVYITALPYSSLPALSVSQAYNLDDLLFNNLNSERVIEYAADKEPSETEPIKESNVKNNIAILKVAFAHPYYSVNNNRGLDKYGTLVHLMKDWGLRESDALTVLKSAELNKKVEFYVKLPESLTKYAKDFPDWLRQSEQPHPLFPPDARGEWAPGYPYKTRVEADIWVPGLKRPQPIKSYLEPPSIKILQTVKRLAEANDGEVFDLGTLSALLFTTRDDNIIEEFIPDLIKGLSGLGHLIFSMYRHSDELKDRFGDSDYKKILGNLKTSFENLGDIIIDLTQQDADKYLSVISEQSESSPIKVQ